MKRTGGSSKGTQKIGTVSKDRNDKIEKATDRKLNKEEDKQPSDKTEQKRMKSGSETL